MAGSFMYGEALDLLLEKYTDMYAYSGDDHGEYTHLQYQVGNMAELIPITGKTDGGIWIAIKNDCVRFLYENRIGGGYMNTRPVEAFLAKMIGMENDNDWYE